jgi:hypothetical protein
MKQKLVNGVLGLVIVAGSFIAISGQKVGIDPFLVKSSTFVEQLKVLKNSNPKQSPEDLAKAANLLLDKTGISFVMSFDAKTCERLRTAKAAQKDPSLPLKLNGKLSSVDAEGASLAFPEPHFATIGCGDCFVELPVLEITDKTFVTVINGRNIKFHLPSNFLVNEARLMDAKDSSLIKTRWRIPFRSSPIGVSYDENVLYLGFDEPELAELSLMVFGEGVFQVGTRTEAEEGGKGTAEPMPANAIYRTVKFDRWQRSYVITYKPKCS